MINRNNYEEYFLLLADSELSPAEEAAVKQFAAKHPDLEEELDLLLSCRLNADPLPVFPKEKLLRTTLWNAANPEPIHTQMLLLLDDELPAAEQQQLQAKIAASTTLQAEWNSLQQTKLVADSIVHPDKESLRNNNRKVRPLLWMRWAAAAAVVTGLGWLLWMQQSPKTTTPDQTLAVISTTKETPRPIAQNQSNSTQQMATVNNSKPAEPTATTATTIEEVATGRQPVKEQVENKQIITAPNGDNQSDNNIPAQLTPVEPEPVLATLNNTDVQLAPLNKNSNTQIAHLTAKPVAVSMLTANSERDAFAGKKESVTGEENDFVTVGGARINKQKMRGLFRNVTRSVARTFSKSKLEPDAYSTR